MENQQNETNREYETGYTIGSIKGGNDAGLLIPPYPHTEGGTEIYKEGYRNGYFMGYTQGLSIKLKANSKNDIQNIIADRLEDISNCMIKENPKQKINKK